MSVNQSRAERTEGQQRKSGRSGSSGQQRGFVDGGRKGGVSAPPTISSSTSHAVPPPSHITPPLSANRSFKKSGNGQGSQARVNLANASSEASGAAPITTVHRAVQNGAQPWAPSPDGPGPGVAKPVVVPIPRNTSRAIPKAPSSQSAAGASNPAAPSAPAKGDMSRDIILQFGSINAGMMNGLQIPARTSSAPPNLDEQKRDQAHSESFGAVPTSSVPSVQKQQHHQQTMKDVGGARQSGGGESHSISQVKRDASASVPSAPIVPAPKASALPISGMPVPMPMPFQPQPPQVPPQYGGPSPQLQSPGLAANSLQMSMTLPVGNTSQVAQQIYVPSIQPHFVQQQTMMHQGQGITFAPPIGHQLPPQLRNLGIGIAPQFPQQQPGNFGGQRKTTVKITHPETHEELRLEKRVDSFKDGVASGQRPLPNVIPQAHSLPTYTASHQTKYFSPMQQNSYSHSQLMFPATVPAASGQAPAISQAPIYGTYPVTQSGQHLNFMNSSMINAVSGGKPAPSPLRHISEGDKLEGLPASASLPTAVKVTMKPSISSQAERVGASLSMPPVVISVPVSKPEAPEVKKTAVADTVPNQRHRETTPDKPSQQLKSGSGSLNNVSLPSTGTSSSVAAPVLSTQIVLTEASSAPKTPDGDSATVLAGIDGKKGEPVQISDSLKDNQRKTSKKDARNSHQQCQLDESSPEGAESSPSKDTKVSFVASQEGSTKTENMQIFSTFELPTSPTRTSPQAEDRILPEVGANETFEGKAMPAASGTSGAIWENESSQDCSQGSVDSSGAAPDYVSIKENFPSEAPTLAPMVVGTNFKTFIANSSVVNTVLKEHVKSEVTNDSLRDPNDAELQSSSFTSGSSQLADESMLLKQDDGVGYYEKVKSSGSDEVDNKVLRGSNDDVVFKMQENRIQDKQNNSTDSENAVGNDLSSTHDVKDKFDTLSTKHETGDREDVGLTDFGVASSFPKPSLSQAEEKPELEVFDLPSDGLVSATSLGQNEKLLSETSKPKITAGRKKKRKEFLSKADAAGTSDLYNAYKGPEEKLEAVSKLESANSSTSDTKIVRVDYPGKDVAASEQNGQNKAELDDWEDAADLSTPRLKTSEHGQLTGGAGKQHQGDNIEATGRKKYSRDFLMTLAHQFTELPGGFEFGSDVTDVSMNILVGKSPVSSPGRIIDRPSGASRVDRRTVGTMDDEKWIKSPGSFGPGPGHGVSIVSLRPGQGVSHGVLRNSRGQGGILSGPTQSMASQGGMPRGNPDADKWQRARGLMPSPQAPLQVMHKAERKYEVGKVSDVEEAKQRRLKAILNKLTPQNFDRLFAQVEEVEIDNAVTLTGVISQIFDKALLEPTFCEMYANFCFHLSAALPHFSENNEMITFKRLLLNKCQEEFERGEREQAEANKVEEEGEIKQSKEEKEQKRLRARRRMLGNIRLIGELYKKKMLTERIMHECIKKLLGQHQNPDEEDVEALCKLISTIGEMIDHPKAKDHMDAYFDMMMKLSTNQNLSSRVRFMLRDAIDLRKNNWQQRRKVEGPKKIEEVHRDAAQERQAQSGRLARGPVISNVPRRGQAVDYGSRGSTLLSSPSSQQVRGLPSQVRGHGAQDVRLEDRHQYETRTMSLPLPQRSTDDDSITLGPQGGLARGMSIRGHPSVPNVGAAEISPVVGEHHRMTSGPNGANHMIDRFSGATYEQLSPQNCSNNYGSRDLKVLDRTSERSATSIVPAGRTHGTPGSSLVTVSETKTFPEEVLREKSISTIKEFYSAKDENEVALCVKELNASSFYPSMISLWVTDSFERKDMERDLLTKLIINLCKSRERLIGRVQLLQGFESVLASLEDAVNDAPRAAEFLGRLFAKIVMENVVPLGEIARLIQEGGEEPGRLREIGLAADVLGNILHTMGLQRGDSLLNDIRLEDFRPMLPTKSNKLDAFLQG
ncbi:hypothetical protein C4D60_Mb11t15610 [Musa balbisiana]|uniref:Eukaryotic translation initiation factor 4G n=1 Tax=Musa balbisiana TaxID=52838 RepID=A0A4S8J5A6_MUSBA|nr:hypothetical protein C4D60_Mb11t15610 [Musa balbisiana]